jgi:hypothetical protein
MRLNPTIRKLEAGELEEFIQLIRLFEEVFGMKNFSLPSIHHLQDLLKKDGFYVFAAVLFHKAAGLYL